MCKERIPSVQERLKEATAGNTRMQEEQEEQGKEQRRDWEEGWMGGGEGGGRQPGRKVEKEEDGCSAKVRVLRTVYSQSVRDMRINW